MKSNYLLCDMSSLSPPLRTDAVLVVIGLARDRVPPLLRTTQPNLLPRRPQGWLYFFPNACKNTGPWKTSRCAFSTNESTLLHPACKMGMIQSALFVVVLVAVVVVVVVAEGQHTASFVVIGHLAVPVAYSSNVAGGHIGGLDVVIVNTGGRWVNAQVAAARPAHVLAVGM